MESSNSTSTKVVDYAFEKVSFVQKISVILQATADEDTPIPGYLYQEINKITLESDGYCNSTLEYLVDRLNKPSCHVKLKVLKLMKYIVEHGHPNFRLGLLKLSKGITDATKHSGPPDPLHGNVPYLVVRKAAKELLELLFDINEEASRPPADLATTRPPSIAPVGIGSSSNHAPHRMEGFGNVSPAPQKSLGKRLLQNISDLAESESDSTADHQREALSALDTPGSYKPPQHVPYTPITDVYRGKEVAPSLQRKVPQHIPGRAGGGWEDSDEEEAPMGSGSSKSSDKKSSDSLESSKRPDHISGEDWSTEQNLVLSILHTGKSTYLTNSEIQEFIRACAGCNCEKVLDFIVCKLEDEDISLVMKCLILIENIIQSDLLNVEFIAKTCKQGVIELAVRQSRPLAIKAKKIIRILEWMTKSAILPVETTVTMQESTLNQYNEALTEISSMQPPD